MELCKIINMFVEEKKEESGAWPASEGDGRRQDGRCHSFPHFASGKLGQTRAESCPSVFGSC